MTSNWHRFRSRRNHEPAVGAKASEFESDMIASEQRHVALEIRFRVKYEPALKVINVRLRFYPLILVRVFHAVGGRRR